MEVMSAREAADKWGISQRRVAVLCSENRIANVHMLGNMWLIPTDAEKPIDARSTRYNITDEKSVEDAYDTVCAVTSELCGIIHLAGIYLLNSLVEIPSDEFQRIFQVNLYGVYLVNKVFLPLLKKGADVIMVTSELAVRAPLPFTGIYGITKTALDQYAYSLRMELQLLDINVSVLRSGAVDTKMIEESTCQLDSFCQNTKVYSCNVKRYKNIVDTIEARRISPIKIAEKIYQITSERKPKFAYSINRNPLLILFDKLPKSVRFYIIRKILTDEKQ